MRLEILHTNDMHGTLSQEKYQKLKVLRESADYYFDTGDVIKTGNLGIPVKQEPAWALLNALSCDASVLGNRETHLIPSAFEAKIAGAVHPLLCGNLRKRDGSHPLPGSIEFERKQIRVGVIGVMVPMVTERMKTQRASAYLWEAPIPIAVELGNQLRQSVDVLIALTHIGNRQDIILAEQEIFDFILGGHSHTILREPQLVGKTWIAQGGSHNRFAGKYTWDGALSGGLVSLDG